MNAKAEILSISSFSYQRNKQSRITQPLLPNFLQTFYFLFLLLSYYIKSNVKQMCLRWSTLLVFKPEYGPKLPVHVLFQYRETVFGFGAEAAMCVRALQESDCKNALNYGCTKSSKRGSRRFWRSMQSLLSTQFWSFAKAS